MLFKRISLLFVFLIVTNAYADVVDYSGGKEGCGLFNKLKYCLDDDSDAWRKDRMPGGNLYWNCHTNDSWGFKCSKDGGGLGITGGPGDFILAGGLGKAQTGTNTDEYAIAGLIALQLVEHGGYFCKYQIQCVNQKKNHISWFEYFRPDGYDCQWFCESGYTGTNCAEQVMETGAQNTTPVTSWVSGVDLKTSGGWEESYTTEISNSGGVLGSGYWDWSKYWDFGQRNVQVGAIKFVENGIVATPLLIGCRWDSWKSVVSWVEGVHQIGGVQKLLCVEGYMPNSKNTDCVYATADMIETRDITFCPGWDRAKYTSAEHSIGKLNETDTCHRYFCKNSDMAFTSQSDHTCAPCATGVMGGPSPKDGTCVKCQHGQYFNKSAGICEPAAAYSNSDLVYGKGHTKNTQPELDKQCWTKVDPTEFVECVTGKKTSTTSTSPSINSSSSGISGSKVIAPQDMLDTTLRK